MWQFFHPEPNFAFSQSFLRRCSGAHFELFALECIWLQWSSKERIHQLQKRWQVLSLIHTFSEITLDWFKSPLFLLCVFLTSAEELPRVCLSFSPPFVVSHPPFSFLENRDVCEIKYYVWWVMASLPPWTRVAAHMVACAPRLMLNL